MQKDEIQYKIGDNIREYMKLPEPIPRPLHSIHILENIEGMLTAIRGAAVESINLTERVIREEESRSQLVLKLSQLTMTQTMLRILEHPIIENVTGTITPSETSDKRNRTEGMDMSTLPAGFGRKKKHKVATDL
jgi:hypothetical protein